MDERVGQPAMELVDTNSTNDLILILHIHTPLTIVKRFVDVCMWILVSDRRVIAREEAV
jgi:hypothetical protein